MFVSQIVVFSFIIISRLDGNTLNLTLEKLTTIRVPHEYSSLLFKLNSYGSKALAYDRDDKILYNVGMFVRFHGILFFFFFSYFLCPQLRRN